MWNHLYACHCSGCMPNRKINMRLRYTWMLVIVNLAAWWSIGQLIEPFTHPYTVTYYNTHSYEFSGQVNGEAREDERSQDTAGNHELVAINTQDQNKTRDNHSNSFVSLTDQVSRMFPEDPLVAVAIAQSESGLNPHQESTTDLMKDGRPFSAGLMQINLTVSSIAGVDCTKAFSGRNYKARVVDEQLYERCMTLAKTPTHNLAAARQKFDGRSQTWGAWGAYNNGAYLQFINN